jgi:hypothetical protein
VLGSGCAVATTTCPAGTKALGVQRPDGRAEWCAVTEAPIANIPATGRSFEGALGIGSPATLPGGVRGPFTTWYPGGGLRSHGSYVDDGSHSLPDGRWTFWYASGQRWLMGRYQHGQPIGCFADWDEHGNQVTGTVTGDRLHAASCTPPADDEVVALEGRAAPAQPGPAWGDASIQGFFGPNHFAAANDEQLEPNPATTVAFDASVRKRFGRLRIGPTFGLRLADGADAVAYTAGASVGWELPSFHPRIDSEVSAELGLEYLALRPVRATQPGTASLAFWEPLPAVQAGMALALSPSIAALASLRLDGVSTHDVGRDVTYCDIGCTTVRETWHLGGYAYGVNLGLRVVIR